MAIGAAGGREAAALTAVFVREGRRERLSLEPTVLRPATPSHIADLRGANPASEDWRVQPTSDGGVLLVDRFRWPGEQNALRFDGDGRLATRFESGDRVEDVLLDSHDRAWITYFDEGIASDDPISQLALARFEPDGSRSWPPGDECGVPWGVWDPWAINLDDDTLWMVYDSQSEPPETLLRLGRDDLPTTWSVPVMATCNGLLIDRDEPVVVELHSEGEPGAAARTVRFAVGDKRLELIRTLETPFAPHAYDGRLVGRGSALWVRNHDIWRRAVPLHPDEP